MKGRAVLTPSLVVKQHVLQPRSRIKPSSYHAPEPIQSQTQTMVTNPKMRFSSLSKYCITSKPAEVGLDMKADIILLYVLDHTTFWPTFLNPM